VFREILNGKPGRDWPLKTFRTIMIAIKIKKAGDVACGFE
jgi:hypothetical protein